MIFNYKKNIDDYPFYYPFTQFVNGMKRDGLAPIDVHLWLWNLAGFS